jgi:hypothetical protein
MVAGVLEHVPVMLNHPLRVMAGHAVKLAQTAYTCLRCRPSTSCPRKEGMDGRDIRAFTPVCDALCAAMTADRF